MIVDLRKLDVLRLPLDEMIVETALSTGSSLSMSRYLLFDSLDFVLCCELCDCWWVAAVLTNDDQLIAHRLLLKRGAKAAATFEARQLATQSCIALRREDAEIGLLCLLLDSACDLAMEHVAARDGWYSSNVPDPLEFWDEFCEYSWNDFEESIPLKEIHEIGRALGSYKAAS